MSLLAWLLLFAASSAFALWIMRWGGAEWIEGWKADLFLGWFNTGSWNAEQIKLYFL